MAVVNDAVNCCVIEFDELEVAVAETAWVGEEIVVVEAAETVVSVLAAG